MVVCPKCRTHNHGRANFCESCGKDLAAEQEADDAIEKMMLGEARKGAIALGIVTGIQVISVLLIDPDNTILWAIAAAFGGLTIWALYMPLVASAVGLTVFVVLHGLEAFADPSSMFRGIVLKVVVIAMLANGIRSGLSHRNFIKERG